MTLTIYTLKTKITKAASLSKIEAAATSEQDPGQKPKRSLASPGLRFHDCAISYPASSGARVSGHAKVRESEARIHQRRAAATCANSPQAGSRILILVLSGSPRCDIYPTAEFSGSFAALSPACGCARGNGKRHGQCSDVLIVIAHTAVINLYPFESASCVVI